jgi:Flp pilus assembly protein TadD
VATAAADREAIEQAVLRGGELLKQGKLEEAQKAFRAALLLDVDNPRVLALLGLVHFRSGQYEHARAIYEDLVERLPTDASHRLNLGVVYLKLGDATKAITALEASRALDPSQSRAISYLGLAYARAGRYAEAYRSFLLAGQTELATEIEGNLTPAEVEGIHAQLQRSGMEVPRPRTPSRDVPPPPTPAPEPRTSPPTPPPAPAAKEAEAPPPSLPVIIVDKAPKPEAEAEPGVPQPPSNDPDAPRMSESQQFVMPVRATPAPVPADGRSMISQAVEIAAPTTAGTTVAGRGARPPVPLSQLATEDLVRPDDSEHPFEISASGALVIRVVDRVLTRLEGVHATGGDLTYEPATRRSRGHQTADRFDYGGAQLHTVTGQGYLIAVPGKRAFTAVTLDDDILYLREDLVFAFDASLRWENGNVPGLRGRLPVVQFRGDGAVALRSEQALVRVKLPPAGIVFVDAARLAGWIGRVIPRAVVPPSGSPMGDVCVECTGEGVVLVDPVGDPGMQLAIPAEMPKPITEKVVPPPPPPPVERHMPPPPPPSSSNETVELDVVKKADWLVDEPEPGRDEI